MCMFYLFFLVLPAKTTGSLVVMKSTFCSINHFISSASSTVLTLTLGPRRPGGKGAGQGHETFLIHSGCFLISSMLFSTLLAPFIFFLFVVNFPLRYHMGAGAGARRINSFMACNEKVIYSCGSLIPFFSP